MQRYLLSLITLFSIFSHIHAADYHEVRGRVLDAGTSEPLAGANVLLIETGRDSSVAFKSYHIDKIKYERARFGAAWMENIFLCSWTDCR